MDMMRKRSGNSFKSIAFQNRLSTRIIFLISSVIIVTTLALSVLYSRTSNNIILQKQSRIKLLQEKHQSEQFFNSINTAQRDVSILSTDPEVLTLLNIHARNDAAGERNRLRTHLQSRFANYARATPDYMQVRLIDVHNGGMELVRIDQTDKGIFVVPEDELQNKSDRDYYREVVQANSDSIYISEINLNREHGVIATPKTPTIRIAKPILDPHKQIIAFVIININLTNTFKAIRSIIDKHSTLYIINENGDYLLNPDKNKEFGFDYGRRSNIQDDFPQIDFKDILGSGNFERREFMANGQEQYLFAIPMDSGGIDLKHKLMVIQTTPEHILSQEIYATTMQGNSIAGLIILLSIAIAIYFARGIIAPVHQLVRATKATRDGNYQDTSLPEASNDEIGILSQKFKEMIRAIKKRENDFQEIYSTYKAVFSCSNDGIVIVDSDGNIEDANDSFYKMIGKDFAMTKNINLVELIEKSYLARDSQDNDCGGSRMQSMCSGDVEILANNDDTYIPASLSVSKFSTNIGEKFATYIHDLSERKRQEDDRLQLMMQLKQAQKMESVGLLASGIAHDFNNVLVAVVGYVELMSMWSDVDKVKMKEYLSEILVSTDKAREMINNLMSFSRSQHDHKTTTDVHKTISEVLTLLEHTLTSRIELRHSIDVNEIELDISPSQLQQIILNLGINSRDAMENKGAIDIHAEQGDIQDLTCTACGQVFSGDYFQLSIQDDGPGIDTTLFKELFRPFFTTKPAGKGTGLGLFMVNTIIHDAHGHISVESRPGQGAKFTIYLPLRYHGKHEVLEFTPIKSRSA